MRFKDSLDLHILNLIFIGLFTMTVLSTSALCQSKSGAMEIGTNFWDVSWGGERNDPFISGHKNVTGENPWKPEFLEEIKIYSVFRFMDWGKTNNAVKAHTKGTRWENRVKKSDRLQKPMAYEWMIDLCNRTERDMWVCVPHFADEHYMYRLACLIRDNLDPKLKCYVEWSNETWNGMFKQAHYCNEQAKKLKLPPGTKWENNLWYRGQMYHAHRTFETFYQFERAFENQKYRLITVIGGTTAHAFAKTHVWAISSEVLNPHKVKPQAYALAPYFGNGLDGSAPDIIQQARQAIAKRLEGVLRVEHVVKEAGLGFITYEGGQHLKQNSDKFCANPAVYNIYLEYLNELEKHFSLFMQYTHNGSHSSRNSWGSKRYIGEPVETAHKYRALRDYVAGANR
jgi:hypothetical protein